MDSTFFLKADRVKLNQDNRKKTFITCVFLFLCLWGSLMVISYSVFQSIFVPIVVGFLGILILIALKRIIYKCLATGYIKNSVVIITNLSNKSYVLEYYCIKKIRTISAGLFSATCLNFKFDGMKKTVILIGRPEVGKSIEKVLTDYKKEVKKASHKPGSVHSEK